MSTNDLKDCAVRIVSVARGTSSRAECRFRSAMTGELPKYGAVLVLVVRSLYTTVFHGVAHIAKHKDREGRHTLPLFGTKSLVEGLPRLSELIQISGSLSQSLRTSLQKSDWITIVHDFDRTFVGPLTDRFCDLRKTRLPILSVGANSTLYSRP